tara:strand:+ start:161 stop:751 length:591 start_codon:yes stop_codon:yes gene_type:complete
MYYFGKYISPNIYMPHYIECVDEETKNAYEAQPKATYVNPIDPMNKYLNFGNYTINLKQLKGGKLQFRTKGGYFVKGLENKRLTPNMKIIIDKLIAGGEILYEDVDRLDDGEKDYLSQMAQKAGINDRLKIPSPMLTKTQSEINKFNVLRGQIVAGNDSSEMIKQFKCLLLKLSNTGHIDRHEANEVMVMLLQLGL